MYCRVLACDFDGTGAYDGHLAPEVATALGRARARGVSTLLVTGRVLEDLQLAEVDLASFDAVVAENGAVVWLSHAKRTILLGTPPPEQFLGELRARGIPLHTGGVVIGTSDRHGAEMLELIHHFGIDSQLVFNRAAMMLLPSGVNKAIGTERALEELGRSARNLIAFGDAENDHPLFAIAEIGVAARGSVPSIATIADEQLSQPGALGVAQYVERLDEAGWIAPTPARHHIVLGRAPDGVEAALPGSGVNVMITGDPREGKSWLAGLAVERLLDHGYRVCVIDPEGDHVALGYRPQVLVFGHELPLPAPGVVARVMCDHSLSVVLDLSTLRQEQKLAYGDAALSALETSRAVTGIPHWTVIDEAHYFFHEPAPCLDHFEGRTGSYVFATYRPSLISDRVYATVAAHLITRTVVEEERYFITGLLQERGPRDLAVAEALGAIEKPGAGLLLELPSGPRWQPFTPDQRVSPHVHHARKYADIRLPDSQEFLFRQTGGARVLAHNVTEFCAAIRTVPLGSLCHHLRAGDFSRWASEVLGDAELASGLRKLELTALTGPPARREEIIRHVTDRYTV